MTTYCIGIRESQGNNNVLIEGASREMAYELWERNREASCTLREYIGTLQGNLVLIVGIYLEIWEYMFRIMIT